jgi:hypothetical protein
MSNHWVPSVTNNRNHGGKKVGYVLRNRSNNGNKNKIKFYTRVVFENGAWQPDRSVPAGTTFVRLANGKNFLNANVARLFKNNFITNQQLYGRLVAKTTHKWSNVNKERNTKNRGVPRNVWVGYPGHLNFPNN